MSELVKRLRLYNYRYAEAAADRIEELELQLEALQPYIKHPIACAHAISSSDYCTCGLQTILEKDDDQ